MSTLVKFLLAFVLHFFQVSDLPKDHASHQTNTVHAKQSIQELNPHYIITRDELLSYKNESAI